MVVCIALELAQKLMAMRQKSPRVKVQARGYSIDVVGFATLSQSEIFETMIERGLRRRD